MQDFLSSNWFRYLVFPFLTTAIGIFVRIETRAQGMEINRVDFAVGPSLILTACTIYVTLMASRAASLIAAQKDLTVIRATTPLNATKEAELQHKIESLTNNLFPSGYYIVSMLISLWFLAFVVRRWCWKPVTEGEKTRYEISEIGILLPLLVGVILLIWVASVSGEIK